MKFIKKQLSLILLKYLRFWARLQIKKLRPTIVAVTGSAGKSSTRRAIALLLSSIGTVKEAKHANSESGIPLNILDIHISDYSLYSWLKTVILAPISYLTNNKHYDYYIVEFGIDSPYPPKNMEYLLSILKPHISVFLNASLVHSEPFDHLVKDKNRQRREKKLIELIANEKGKILTTLNKQNIAIMNIDQPEIRNLKPKIKARLITVGRSSDADIRITRVNSKKSFSMTIQHHNKAYKLNLNNIPLERNYSYTLASAIAVAKSLGMPISKSVELISSQYTPPAGRWRIFKGINNSTIIDSSYNASPLSMNSAITSFNRIAGDKHKILVLGDMRELGMEEKQAHKDLASWIMDNSDEAMLFGPLTKKYTLPILKKHNFPAKHFKYMSDLIEYLKKSIKQNSYILFKASQNTLFLERAVEAVLLNKEDSKYLCRRGKYWDKIRAQTP